MVRLQQEAHLASFEEWGSVMSFKIFLLERELGYQITGDMNGLALIERLKMFDRYCEIRAEKDKSGSGGGKSKNKKGLMK